MVIAKIVSINLVIFVKAASSDFLVLTVAPTWEKLGEAFKDEETVLVGQLDADNADNRATASRFGVKGYPTIKVSPAFSRRMV